LVTLSVQWGKMARSQQHRTEPKLGVDEIDTDAQKFFTLYLRAPKVNNHRQALEQSNTIVLDTLRHFIPSRSLKLNQRVGDVSCIYRSLEFFLRHQLPNNDGLFIFAEPKWEIVVNDPNGFEKKRQTLGIIPTKSRR
jgi:hypothetical protein